MEVKNTSGSRLTVRHRNGEIEVLRFLFSVIIVIYHCNPFYGKGFPFYGGALAVEFFFLVSGYLMMQTIDRRNKQGASTGLGKETVEFILKKIKVLMPEFIVAWIIAFIFVVYANKIHFGSAVKLFFGRQWELYFIRMAGWGDGNINGVTWYISSMLLCMFVLYPLIRKFPEIMTYIGLPLSAIFVMGWLTQHGNLRSSPHEWLGFFYKGTVRAFGELSAGALCYFAAQYIKKLNLTKLGKWAVSCVKWGCYMVVGLFLWKTIEGKYDYAFFLTVAILIITIFSEQGIDANWCTGPFADRLGRLSLPIYLSHIQYRNYIKKVFPDITDRNKLLAIYLLMAFVTTIFVVVISDYLRKHKDSIYAFLKKLFIADQA